jgi:endoglucanase
MKNKWLLILVIGAFFFAGNLSNGFLGAQVQRAAGNLPFSKGVNFSGWFQGFSAETIQFTRYVEQDFVDAKRLGVDVIRLPVNFQFMTSGAPNYIIDPLLLDLLDIAVDWAEKHQIYLIINNHTYDPNVNGMPPFNERRDRNILLRIWPQIAERYKDRSEYILYQIFNEPYNISDRNLGRIQGEVIDAIRRIDQKHTIVVGGIWTSIDGMLAMPAYNDNNLIYTFHFYLPGVFTHQGASWGEPRADSLRGVPWPFDVNRMPEIPANLRRTWLESELRNYERAGSRAAILAELDRAVAFSRERNVPLICGELGVLMWNAPAEDRIEWYRFVCNALSERNIAWTSWDYYGAFGIFNADRAGLDFNSDLNIELVRAMGFTVPPQRQRIIPVPSSGFTFYDDFVSGEFDFPLWDAGEVSFFDRQAAEGRFAIRWANAAQYNSLTFRREMDLSRLAAVGYVIEFKARTQTSVRFDVRFEMPDTDSSMPWRIKYTIDERILPPDGRWHTIRIPLRDMQEQGAWVNATQQWHSPRGEFSWRHIASFRIVAEENNLLGRTIWFDSIKVTAP